MGHGQIQQERNSGSQSFCKPVSKISIDDGIYVCHTCDKAVKRGTVPAQSKANGMDLPLVPEVLQELNELEVRLVSRRLLFMQLIELPAGRQKGLKGPAVNVSANVGPAIKLLPRIPKDYHVVTIKFKRKLQYKTAYLTDYVHPEKVMTALQYLKEHNCLYEDVIFNDRWLSEWEEDATGRHYSSFVNAEQVPDVSTTKEQITNSQRTSTMEYIPEPEMPAENNTPLSDAVDGRPARNCRATCS